MMGSSLFSLGSWNKRWCIIFLNAPGPLTQKVAEILDLNVFTSFIEWSQQKKILLKESIAASYQLYDD